MGRSSGGRGRSGVVGNLSTARTAKADNHDGEPRLAALYETHPGLLVGLDARYRRSCFSTDPNRFARDRPEYKAVAGPTASYIPRRVGGDGGGGLVHGRTTTTQTGLMPPWPVSVLASSSTTRPAHEGEIQ